MGTSTTASGAPPSPPTGKSKAGTGAPPSPPNETPKTGSSAPWTPLVGELTTGNGAPPSTPVEEPMTGCGIKSRPPTTAGYPAGSTPAYTVTNGKVLSANFAPPDRTTKAGAGAPCPCEHPQPAAVGPAFRPFIHSRKQAPKTASTRRWDGDGPAAPPPGRAGRRQRNFGPSPHQSATRLPKFPSVNSRELRRRPGALNQTRQLAHMKKHLTPHNHQAMN